MHASVRGSYTKWYVKVGGHYWHQILLSVFLWAKSTTERWSREGNFSPYAIYSGRALSVQTRWNSIFCRAARISMSHVFRFRSLPANVRGRSRVVGEKPRVGVSCFNASRFYGFLARQILTVNSTRAFAKVAKETSESTCVKHTKILRRHLKWKRHSDCRSDVIPDI